MVWNVYIHGPVGYVFLCGGYASRDEAETEVGWWKQWANMRGDPFDYRREPSGDPDDDTDGITVKEDGSIDIGDAA